MLEVRFVGTIITTFTCLVRLNKCICVGQVRLAALHYTVKKVHEFPVSSRDVTNQTPPVGRNNSVMTPLFQPMESLVNGRDIPAGDGKLANLFFAV
jgi:hypothetical protein